MLERWRELENQIRSGVHDELSRDKKRWKEYKRKNRPSRHLLGSGIQRILFTVYAGTALGVFAAGSKTAVPFAAMTSLYLLAFFKLRAQFLFQYLYHPQTTLFAAHYPISNETLFRNQLRLFFKQSLWTMLDGLMAGFYLSLIPQSGFQMWMSPGFAALHWLLTVNAAAAMVLFRPAWVRFIHVPALFGLIIGLGFYFFKFPSANDASAAWICHILPPGWISIAYLQAAQGASGSAILLAFAAAAMAASLYYLIQRLRAAYDPNSILTAAYQDESEDTVPKDVPEQEPELRAALAASAQPWNWSQMRWLERLAGAWLTPREKIVAELFLHTPPLLSRQLEVGVFAGCAGLAFCFLPQPFNHYGFSAAGIFMLMALFPITGGSWAGFERVSIYGTVIPAYSVVPIHFDEFSKLILKINYVRILAAFPLASVIAISGASLLGLPVVYASTVCLKFLAVICLVQPVLVVFHISPTTNDSKRTMSIAVVLLFILLMLGCVVWTFLSESTRAAALSILFFGSMSAGVFFLYRRQFINSRFDTMNQGPENSAV